MLSLLCFAQWLVAAVFSVAPSGSWDTFNLSPRSKTVYPRFVHNVSGAISNAEGLVSNGPATFSGSGSYVTLDFGQEVGGLISMNFDEVASTSAVALSFTESPLYISPLTSDDSADQSANMSYDGVLEVHAPLEVGLYTMPSVHLRGGFRYLTVVYTSDSSVTISNISCAITFMPHVEDLRNYTGYFYATDPSYVDHDFLTKIWYSGAYTVQTATIAADTGRVDPPLGSPGWYNNATAGIATPLIIDGAKRGRAIWLADMGIAVPTEFVSTYDLTPARNSIESIFSEQNPETGELPYSGPPLSEQGSDTYQAWTLIGTYNYYLYTGDTEWLQGMWSNYTKAMQYLANKVDDTGLLYVTGTGDWGRLWQGGYNSEANAIFYKVLLNSAELASYLSDSALAAEYIHNATVLKTKFNEAFWSENEGMYRDNETSTLFPQDGNAIAVLYNLTTAAEQASSISDGLTKNWNEFGAISPELPDNIAPFIGGFEVQAHFVAGNDARALELLHLEWGYMLYTPISVGSTFLEGYTSNGSLYYRSYDGYNYDASFVSHSHGWSTGPTSALTFYVLGLTVTSPQGQTWSVAPHTSGLPAAQGGFSTPLGWFGVDWTSSADSFNVSISTPEGTSGAVSLPMNGTIIVDGAMVAEDGSSPLSVTGGNHTITVQS
ncbi:glycoside hydrolase family 78 protein [Laetiporus sulphureus 93-53]|uniref:Glycoside hydrolase family 78 protein n=1 Tax=Laetiporus sulphureus 93-53 TaxID=1314785 RepID=A0A165B6X8_9APHY|nr:glycoside hydrolase family 78 protein [Laetiporus sulphureus 93-53]KZT00384.1 glycoside hydrolase family 78 protein [Laetiporus sulphureus 93-53]